MIMTGKSGRIWAFRGGFPIFGQVPSPHISTASCRGRRETAVTEPARSSRLNAVSTAPTSSSISWVPPQQRLDVLATKPGEKCGLAQTIIRAKLGSWSRYPALLPGSTLSDPEILLCIRQDRRDSGKSLNLHRSQGLGGRGLSNGDVGEGVPGRW